MAKNLDELKSEMEKQLQELQSIRYWWFNPVLASAQANEPLFSAIIMLIEEVKQLQEKKHKG